MPLDTDADLSDFVNPYKPGTKVIEGEIVESGELVRFFNDKNQPAGRWVARKADVKGMMPEEIADYLGLPEIPTLMTDLIVTPGTPARFGVAGPGFGRSGGGYQIELFDGFDSVIFGAGRPIQW